MDRVLGFFSGVKKEVKRSHWIKGKDLLKESIICITMILFFAAFFYILDLLFTTLRGLI